MCIVAAPIVGAIATAVSAAAAVAGGIISYTQGQNAANAAKSAQQQAMTSQNAQFQARMQAQREQLSSQTEANTQSAQRFQDTALRQHEAQAKALQDKADTVNTINQQQALISNQADQAVKTATTATSPQALQDAQSQQAAQQMALAQPAPQVTNPLAPSASSSSVTDDPTQSAYQKGQEAAAKTVQQYGQSLANLSAYNAPLALAGRTSQDLGTGLLPLAARQQLVQAGAPALIAPSELAYQQAKQYGMDEQTYNKLLTDAATTLINTKAQGAIDVANLKQADDAAIIQGGLNSAQAKAAQGAALGQGVQQLGQFGLQWGASQGGLSSLFAPALPAGAQVPVSMGGLY